MANSRTKQSYADGLVSCDTRSETVPIIPTQSSCHVDFVVARAHLVTAAIAVWDEVMQLCTFGNAWPHVECVCETFGVSDGANYWMMESMLLVDQQTC